MLVVGVIKTVVSCWTLLPSYDNFCPLSLPLLQMRFLAIASLLSGLYFDSCLVSVRFGNLLRVVFTAFVLYIRERTANLFKNAFSDVLLMYKIYYIITYIFNKNYTIFYLFEEGVSYKIITKFEGALNIYILQIGFYRLFIPK